ncbi:hypothetical protein V494_03211 [Pseudogymnoascus sp. VKM F-4513 (FW-928)]|nr:hypothetical protein V494_03211 [Pseudogymnoascus sp. VKM F-4513 (FW-928)]
MASGLKGLDKLRALHRRITTSALNSTLGPGTPPDDVRKIKRLRSQPPNFIYDKLSHHQSSPYFLLETALSTYLPDSVNCTLPKQPSSAPWELPAGYHLVFFPPPTKLLIKDGTDNMHYPGKPWVRRMWAGGSIDFMTDRRRRHLECRYTQSDYVRCREEIVNAVVKGSPGKQKFWVDLRRTIGPSNGPWERPLRGGGVVEQAAIIERRNLVFMPAKTSQEAKNDISQPIRTIKREQDSIIHPKCGLHIATDHSTLATNKPDFSVSMVPDSSLLFRFSALTFNAHRIHLDREYARTVEGFRNLVVHGPLSILLILKVLGSQMGSSKRGVPHKIKSITYKNLAPLFADEKMTICVKRSQPQPKVASTEANGTETPANVDSKQADEYDEVQRWDVWIENQEGGYAVKGTAETVATTSVLRYVGTNDTTKDKASVAV